ncbi:MAG: hypothetical protein KBB32_08250 [Spirochaetia bacterium]|nr:hypothetical protein [Spirochaetia bacterium]
MKRLRAGYAACLLAFLSASCAGSASLVLRPDRSALIDVSVRLPAQLEAKLRSLSGVQSGPLFSAEAVSEGASDSGLVVRSSRNEAAGYQGSFTAADLDQFIRSAGLAGALTVKRGSGWASLSLTIDRGTAPALVSLFPGLDQDLLEALQPPALYDNPVSQDEYRSMLVALLGTQAASALDTLDFSLSISVPGPILESEGFSAPRPGLAASSRELAVPVLRALTLERPLSFFIKWKE